MNVAAGWQRFWFRPSPYFDLAVIRLIIVAFSLYWLFDYSFAQIHYSFTLHEELWSPIPAVKALLLPLGWGERPDSGLVLAVFWGTVVVGMLAFIGLLTNLSLLLFALGNIFLQAFIYSFGDPHHREAIMNVTLLAFALAPCGRVLSLDRWLSLRRHGAPARGVPLLDECGPFAGWPIRMMQLFFAFMYLSAVSSKLSTGGLDWANGYTLQYYLLSDSLRKGGIPLGEFFAQHHTFILALQWVVLIFQATFILVVFFPRLRWVYLPVGLCFHIGIYLTLHAPFPQRILLYSLFVPWSEVVRWLARQGAPAPAAGGEG